jgi:hypothetical protein
MTKVQDAYPEVYVQSGIMERGNFSVCLCNIPPSSYNAISPGFGSVSEWFHRS